MGTLLAGLDREWARLKSEGALTESTSEILALAGQASDWTEAQKWMRSPAVDAADKNRVLAALMRQASGDAAIARIILALLMPGITTEICRHVVRTKGRDPWSTELEATAIEAVWRRVRTYPTTRRGSVAANVLLDLRKELCRRPTSVRAIPLNPSSFVAQVAPPDEVLEEAITNDVTELVTFARQQRWLSAKDAEVILDTRVRGVGCKNAAALRSMPERTFRRRQRAAEHRLATHARAEFVA